MIKLKLVCIAVMLKASMLSVPNYKKHTQVSAPAVVGPQQHQYHPALSGGTSREGFEPVSGN
jgi:hypothetical protein